MKYIIRHLLLHVLIWLPVFIYGQDCITTYGSLYGTTEGNEYGYTLAPTSSGDGFYIGGFKDDSALLVKMNLVGEVVWSRSFDIIPGKADHLNTLYLESTGDLVMGGVSGSSQSPGESGFVTRYDPDLDLIVWSKEFVPDYTYTHCWDIIEKGPGGNYIFSIDEVNTPGSNIDAQLLELNRNTGALNLATSKNYHLGSSEDLNQIELSGNFIYGAGRYSDGSAPADMRHTIVKLDANTFNQVWVKMGHQPGNVSARLYGFGLVIESDIIYSGYFGDPAGTSTTNTKIYVQKTDLDGNVIWIKQYELPGSNDFGYEIIRSNGGLVVYAFQQAAPKRAILFKIDFNGVMQWAKSYQFPSATDITSNWFGRGQLIEVGANLVFTGWAMTAAEGAQMIVVRADLNGTVDMPCVTQQDISVPVTTLSNPTFYAVNPTVTNATPTANSESPEKVETLIVPGEECVTTDTLLSLIQASICEGEVYEGYTVAGTYEDYFITTEGCDSLRTLELEVNLPSNAFEQVEICLGLSYSGYDQTGIYVDVFQNAFGCDSFHTLDLTVVPLENFESAMICQGQEYEGYTDSGFYVDTIQGPFNSCDTVQYLTLIVLPAVETFLEETICEGEEYEGYTVTGVYIDLFVNTQGCDSIRTLDLSVADEDLTEEFVQICFGNSYSGYTETGVYTSSYQNIFGCDSIYVLNLEVIPFEVDLSVEICEGEQYAGYTMTGFYQDTLEGINNECDTIRYLDLLVNGTDETILSVSICEGDVFEGYTVSGQYFDTFININGCDSMRILDLTVTNEILTEINIVICEGAEYNGYTDEGTYIDIYTSEFGCDSIRTLHLTVNDEILSELNVAICEGANYDGYSVQGIYVDTFTTAHGCDSIRTLQLSVLNELLTTLVADICLGETYEGHSTAGTYVDTFASFQGCDSIRTLELSVTIPVKDVSVSICAGDMYGGYSLEGIYIDTLPGIPGSCDTIRNLTLNVMPPLLTYINASICEGQTFLNYDQTGMYSDTFQTFAGCDSVRMLSLTVSDLIMTSQSATICPGEFYEGYNIQGTYQDTFISSFGCDSIRLLDLMVEMPQIDMMVNICDGENFEGYDQPGIFIDTLYGNGNQCDTLRNLTITLLPLTVTSVTESICTGQNYFGYATTGIYTDTFDVTGGCDSVRIVNLTVSDVIMTSMDRIICFGDFFEGYLAEGIYIDTFQSIGGCDSVRVLNLEVDIEQKFIEVEICAGASFEHHTSSGVYIDTIQATGIACDTMRELILTVKAPVFDQIDYTMCEGESYLGYSQPGLYYDTLVTNKGCDSIRELHLIQIDKVETQVSASICDDLPYKYTRPGEYVDTLISYRGCDSILTFEVIGVSHYLPNVFSPNDDGINDLFYTTFFPDEEIQLEYFAIFDRFGNMAYSTSKWPIIWNGKDQKNESFQPAVFAYVFIYTCGANRIIEHGDITLIK